MKILNLYSGIGGNRKKWGNNHNITAVEIDNDIAKVYKDFFPNDTVIVGDAHEYLINNFMNFDFIWSSPPCPSHSRIRYLSTFNNYGTGTQRNIIYPDLRLYEEIILLQKYAKCKWLIENVNPYYEPLIKGKKIGRHLVWCNFPIQSYDDNSKLNIRVLLNDLQIKNDYDLSKYKFKKRKEVILRNCVDADIGLHILNNAMQVSNLKNVNQLKINI